MHPKWRGITVAHAAVHPWWRQFGQDAAHRLRRRPPPPGDTWEVDDVCLTIHGKRHARWRAVDQNDHVKKGATEARVGPQ